MQLEKHHKLFKVGQFNLIMEDSFVCSFLSTKIELIYKEDL